jgi:ketosteroid isomerase-like protein
MVRCTLSLKETVVIMALPGIALTTGCRSTPGRMAPDIGEYRAALKQADSVDTMAPGSTVEKEALERFNAFYEVYSSEAIRKGVRGLYAENAWFGDPFHSVRGIDAVEHYFLAMAEPVETCTFTVEGMQRSGDDYYARWTMHLVSKAAKGKPIDAIGMSHVRFNSEGLIVFQQDYWDTSVMFDRLPVVGYWTRLVKRRLEKEIVR